MSSTPEQTLFLGQLVNENSRLKKEYDELRGMLNALVTQCNTYQETVNKLNIEKTDLTKRNEYLEVRIVDTSRDYTPAVNKKDLDTANEQLDANRITIAKLTNKVDSQDETCRDLQCKLQFETVSSKRKVEIIDAQIAQIKDLEDKLSAYALDRSALEETMLQERRQSHITICHQEQVIKNRDDVIATINRIDRIKNYGTSDEPTEGRTDIPVNSPSVPTIRADTPTEGRTVITGDVPTDYDREKVRAVLRRGVACLVCADAVHYKPTAKWVTDLPLTDCYYVANDKSKVKSVATVVNGLIVAGILPPEMKAAFIDIIMKDDNVIDLLADVRTLLYWRDALLVLPHLFPTEKTRREKVLSEK